MYKFFFNNFFLSNILNNRYLLVVNKVVDPTNSADYATIVTEREYFKNVEGVTFVAGTSKTSGFMPMAILGAIDFTEGKVTNFMFTDATIVQDITISS